MGGVPVSRPPSRADNPTLDLSADHAAASASNAKTLKEQEEMDDQELQRAMAESLRPSFPAQENGVTQTKGNFGPAKRPHYEPNNWALTTYSTSREIIEHPPPSKRRRIRDTPAFLRGSKDTGYLGSLLTIYQNIPLARHALLMPSLKVHAYDHDNSWWSGATDENNKALSADNSLLIDKHERNLLTEVQCLMAFLEGTTRAYGSVDALLDLQAVRKQTGDQVNKFLEAWSSAALQEADEEQLTQIFSSVAMKANPGHHSATEKTLYCVEPFINHHPGETLTDLLDHTIWDDRFIGVDDVWISRCAEIFTIRLQDPSTAYKSVDVTLDPIWYSDRYMYDCREEMQQIRKQVQAIGRQIEQYTHQQRRCQILTLPNNRALDISDVLHATMEASTVAANQDTVSSGLLNGRQRGSDSTITQTDVEELNSELLNVLEKIRERLAQLEQRKEELKNRSRQITMQLTKPTPDRPNVPHRKYTLQGVATKSGITYFRQQNINLDLLQGDDINQEGAGYQWWRSSWLQGEPQQKTLHPPMIGPVTQAQAEDTGKSPADDYPPYSIDRVLESDVLDAVKKGHNSVLLVYANESAVSFRGSGLSTALRQFVDRDNQAFAEDLRQEEGPLPASSADRDTETEFEDVPLIDRTISNSSVRELTPMSTSSPENDVEASSIRPKEGSSIQSPEVPPSYDDSLRKQEMQERKENRIGLHAEKLLQRYGNEAGNVPEEKDDSDEPLLVEGLP